MTLTRFQGDVLTKRQHKRDLHPRLCFDPRGAGGEEKPPAWEGEVSEGQWPGVWLETRRGLERNHGRSLYFLSALTLGLIVKVG